MRWIMGIWAYGALIGLLRHNQFSPFAYDLRISIALLSGLALVECAPKRLPQIAVALVAVTTGGVALSLLLLLALPSSALEGSMGGRITAESAFFFIGPPLVLTAPAIMLSWLAQRRRLLVLAWVSGWALLFEIVVLMQTRSLAISAALALLLAWLSSTALVQSRPTGHSSSRRAQVIGTGTALMMAAMSGWLLVNRSGAVLAFFARMSSGVHLASDTTWLIRAAEVVDVFGSMSLVDHLVGLGLGPTPHANVLGVPVFSFHIGVLNIWWRFGAVVFLILLWSIVHLARLWWAARSRLLSPGFRSRRDVALVAIAPGVLALAAQAFISGGWAVTSMLALGIVWGVYRVLVDYPIPAFEPSRIIVARMPPPDNGPLTAPAPST